MVAVAGVAVVAVIVGVALWRGSGPPPSADGAPEVELTAGADSAQDCRVVCACCPSLPEAGPLAVYTR